MPFIMGSETPSTALAAMPASMAEPPCSRTRAPACDAWNLAGGDDAVLRRDDGAAIGAVLRGKADSGEDNDGQRNRNELGSRHRRSPVVNKLDYGIGTSTLADAGP